MRPKQTASLQTFDKFDRQVLKLAARPGAQAVHRFRTYGRRVEALMSATQSDAQANTRKLLKVLSRMRKKAGKVRDIDVQVSTLRTLKVAEDSKRKTQLIRVLLEERPARERKLMKAFSEERLKDLRKRLRRARAKLPDDMNPFTLALREMHELTSSTAPCSEETLHECRIKGKRVRYLAEMASGDPDADRIVEILKRMQDVVGDWHDWLKLSQRAEDMFGRSQDSPLVAMLRNVTQAKFRVAVDGVQQARTDLSTEAQATSASRRTPQAAKTRAAAA